ncbi:glycoprotein-N-acetylgalactosamine 3-beta-galactosyltransferase 1-like isoform X1 [Pomacea canaliculata]|uniref:glycoprotein-N-acetylgalactosamine 3-beta-galactosyltransferase 1-like isoform X1 n=2 Tax=Pomacea canaliculata TaxID=400727 RepID=UPI000D73FD2A|nr:glycoprotein-N-acetylgalactosamine 3-beta-galactosyltransferase 1-like isoform X1 [Pomacea canaliculata]
MKFLGKMLGILAVLTVSFVIPGYYMLFQNAIRMNPQATGDFAYLKCISRESDGDVDDVSEARLLKKEVRVLVWVMTSPQNLQTRARAVRDTWGKHCNKLLFFSSETDKNFPTIGLNVSEGREHLTAKTMNGFRYVYEHHLDDADWFMKVDDDTYVIVENLRYFLSNEDTREPVWFGHHFKIIVKQGYYSGGGGYVLSKEALKRLYEKVVPAGSDPKVCRQDGGGEDAELGRCMETLGVRTSNTSDVMGRSRFHCFDPETFLSGNYPDWYYHYDTNGAQKGIDVMSDYSITFHYVSPEKMQALEFYIYHLHPYGINKGRQNLNRGSFRSQEVQPTRR